MAPQESADSSVHLVYQDLSPLKAEGINAAQCRKCNGSKDNLASQKNRHMKKMSVKQLKNSKNGLSQLSQVRNPFFGM